MGRFDGATRLVVMVVGIFVMEHQWIALSDRRADHGGDVAVNNVVTTLVASHVAANEAELLKTLRSVWIPGIPHIVQRPDFCGEACAAMYLRAAKCDFDQDDVFNMSGLDPLLARGCHTPELQEVLRRIGFSVGPVWQQVNARRADPELLKAFRALHSDLLKGWPSIVCMRFDEQPEATEHFRLIVGYDPKRDEILFHEPAEPNGAYKRMPLTTFLKLWPLKYEEDRWTVIRMKLEISRVRQPPSTGKFSPADYCQHMMELKKKVPDGFSIVIQKPFVVIGDEDEQGVRRRANGTIRWAVTHLKRSFFAHDPNEILDIWLFKDEDSYNQGTKEIFGDTVDTPFGYFSPKHRALIMNIATGGGTLVHEIVHPFMDANFPACPAWFNEGLASLYEQSDERRGQIIGLTNWRLEGLQKVIESEDRDLPSFAELCGTTTSQFYGEDPGTNYAQARYLCYYLQQRGLLRRYYREFLASAKDDPGGYRTLQKVVAADDMVEFQKQWESWVMTLRFP